MLVLLGVDAYWPGAFIFRNTRTSNISLLVYSAPDQRDCYYLTDLNNQSLLNYCPWSQTRPVLSDIVVPVNAQSQLCRRSTLDFLKSLRPRWNKRSLLLLFVDPRTQSEMLDLKQSTYPSILSLSLKQSFLSWTSCWAWNKATFLDLHAELETKSQSLTYFRWLSLKQSLIRW